ncbi:MAG: thioredoxin family protein [Bacteroidetes bacterium]|nr:thioredoxin family protein [Bacteroidota bacterium]
MEIKVLGTGCSSCKALFETVKQAVNELEIDANIIKEEDMMQIMSYKIMRLPALVIDEKVVSAGKKLSLKETKELLTK